MTSRQIRSELHLLKKTLVSQQILAGRPNKREHSDEATKFSSRCEQQRERESEYKESAQNQTKISI